MKAFQRVLILSILILSAAATATADNIKVITGTATYVGKSNQTKDQIYNTALEMARLDALSREYGVSVDQTIYAHETMTDSGSSSYFDNLSATTVNGEWIADEGKPQYDVSLDDDLNLVVKCTVKIKAREKTNERVDFEAVILKNGITLDNADTKFKSGDKLYVHFKAPADGYVTVYLMDDQQNVYNLLPYHNDTYLSVPVKKGKDYTFFYRDYDDPSTSNVDPLYLYTDKEYERNEMYVIYSPNAYNKAKDTFVSSDVPSMLPRKDFTRWLTDSQRNDKKMNAKHFSIEIEK